MENKKDTKNKIKINGPILYTDCVSCTVSSYGIVLDFMQDLELGISQERNVVARVGMARKHAEALLYLLQKNLERIEVAKFTNISILD